jgi:hypothetical protein
MATFALVSGSKIIEMSPTAFPVNPAFVWTGDVSAVSPEPQVGWTAAETGGAWTFTTPPAPSAPDTRIAAKLALDLSDITMIRCFEHSVAVPAAWTAYRATLRAIVSGTSTTAPLPAMPAYPAGT